MKFQNPFAQKYFKPFKELKIAEEKIRKYEPTGDTDVDLSALRALLAQERMLDYCRPLVFERHGADNRKTKEYIFREYMVRHQISEFALKLSKEVTDRITGENLEEKSFVAMCIKNRELYPEPKQN